MRQYGLDTALRPDVDAATGADTIEQRDYVGIAHPHAAVRARHAHRFRIGRTVNVDVAAHAVHTAVPVIPGLFAAQPQDPAEHPVPPGVLPGQFLGIDFAGCATSHEHRARRLPSSDAGPDAMPAAGRSHAVGQFAGTVAGRGHGPSTDNLAALEELQGLPRYPDEDFSRHRSCKLVNGRRFFPGGLSRLRVRRGLILIRVRIPGGFRAGVLLLILGLGLQLAGKLRQVLLAA